MSGDPGAVSLLAQRMSNLAQDVDAMRDKFSARYLGGIWTGEAFEAFAKTLEAVPRDLEKVGTSYRMASDALDVYSTALEEVQRKASELATQSTHAEARTNTAGSQHALARNKVNIAESARATAVDPGTQLHADRNLQHARNDLAGAELRHQEATDDLAALRTSARTAVEAFDGDVKTCCQRLHAASEAGIQNSPLSWYSRHVADGPIGILLSPLTDLADLRHIIDVIKDPGDLAAWRGLLDGLGAAVAIAAIAVVVVGTGGTALLVVGAIGVGVAGAKLGVDVARKERGEDVSGSDLGWDVVGLGGAAVPFAAGKFSFAAKKLAAKKVPFTWKEGTLPKYRKAWDKAATASEDGNKAWATRYRRYGLSGQPMPKAERLKELRNEAIKTYGKEAAAQTYESIKPPDNFEACLVPHPGLGASPLGVIRHVRPIAPRPMAVAGVP